MKRITDIAFNTNFLHIILLFIRMGVGFAMLSHGMSKFTKFFADGPIEFADPLGVGVQLSLGLTVFAELFCSIFIILGLWTRLAVFPLIITMLVIILIVHPGDGLKKQELPLMYLLIYLLLLVAGSGKYSVDRFLK